MFPTNRLSSVVLLLSATALFIALVLVVRPASPPAEAAPNAIHTVTTLNDSGAGSLRQVLQDTAVGDQILFDVSGTIVLTSELIIDKRLTINGRDQITLSGDNNTRILYITAEAEGVVLNNLTFTDGLLQFSACSANSALCDGGAILNNGTLTVNHSTITDSYTQFRGGGIHSNGTLIINHSTIANNTAEDDGGGVSNYRGTLSVNGSTITQNSSGTIGGGLENYEGTTAVVNSTITQNNARNSGGGLDNVRGDFTLHNSIIAENTAGFGAGLRSIGTLHMSHAHMADNQATSSGGGLSLAAGSADISYSTFQRNTAASGAGISNDAALTVSASTFSGNVATENSGGGLDNNNVLILSNSTFSGNEAQQTGGGLLLYVGATAVLHNNTFYNNTAASFGGGIYSNGTLTLNRNIFVGNSADQGAEIGISGAIVNAANFNIIGANDEPGTYGFVPSGTDIVPSGAPNTVLDLALADNGGPTPTHALATDSDALDVAPPAACTPAPIHGRDQRGAARSFNDACDSGAFEVRESITLGVCDGADLDGPQTFNFASSGNQVVVNVQSANGLKCLTVQEMGPGVTHPVADFAPPNTLIQASNWWHIAGNIDEGFVVDLTLPDTGANERSRLCQWPGSADGLSWDCGAARGVDTTAVVNSTVTRHNISQLSDWTVGTDTTRYLFLPVITR